MSVGVRRRSSRSTAMGMVDPGGINSSGAPCGPATAAPATASGKLAPEAMNTLVAPVKKTTSLTATAVMYRSFPDSRATEWLGRRAETSVIQSPPESAIWVPTQASSESVGSGATPT